MGLAPRLVTRRGLKDVILSVWDVSHLAASHLSHRSLRHELRDRLTTLTTDTPGAAAARGPWTGVVCC